MRILFLSPRQCWPPLTGAKLREYYLAKSLGEETELTHVSFSDTQSGLSVAELPFCRRVVSVPRPQRYTFTKMVRGLLGRWPLPVVNYTSDEMKASLATLFSQQDFDLLHLESLHMAGYLPLLKQKSRAPIVFDWHNIESELMRRSRDSSRSVPRKLYIGWTAARLARLEAQILRQAAGHIVCSPRELQKLQAIVPDARIAVIENGVDPAFFGDTGAPVTGRARIVFVGSMDYHANVEAACAFVHAVWPSIRARFPDWRLTLVGSNPAPAVLALGHQPNVEVTGTVPDVRPYYRDALAAIVPLRTGGGTRLKILEAMAAGVPVISTTLGAEGLAVIPSANILIADNDEDWLPLITRMVEQPELWSSLAKAGRDLVRSRYDWQILGKSLYQTYCRWFGW